MQFCLPTLDMIVGGGHSCESDDACSRVYSQFERLSLASLISRNSPGHAIVAVEGARSTSARQMV